MARYHGPGLLTPHRLAQLDRPAFYIFALAIVLFATLL